MTNGLQTRNRRVCTTAVFSKYYIFYNVYRALRWQMHCPVIPVISNCRRLSLANVWKDRKNDIYIFTTGIQKRGRRKRAQTTMTMVHDTSSLRVTIIVRRCSYYIAYVSVVGIARAFIIIYHSVHNIVKICLRRWPVILIYIIHIIIFFSPLLLLILFCMHYCCYYYYFAVCFMIYIYLFFLLFCAFFVG